MFKLPDAYFPCDPWEDAIINRNFLRGSKSVLGFQWMGLQPCARTTGRPAQGCDYCNYLSTCQLPIWPPGGNFPWVDMSLALIGQRSILFYRFILTAIYLTNPAKCNVIAVATLLNLQVSGNSVLISDSRWMPNKIFNSFVFSFALQTIFSSDRYHVAISCKLLFILLLTTSVAVDYRYRRNKSIWKFRSIIDMDFSISIYRVLTSRR